MVRSLAESSLVHDRHLGVEDGRAVRFLQANQEIRRCFLDAKFEPKSRHSEYNIPGEQEGTVVYWNKITK